MFLSALACVAFVGSSFASNEIVVDFLKTNDDKIEQAIVTCWWRTVYHHSDGSKTYGPWIKGECYDSINQNGDRLLIPIRMGQLVR